MERMGVALIGAGNISDQYLTNLRRYPEVELLAIGSRNEARAAEQAESYGVAKSGSIDSVLADPAVGLVLNLTVPAVHAEFTSRALRAGKHVWSEKPLALDRESAKGLLDLATQRGLRLGCAPDTVLCPGVQGSLAAVKALEQEYGEPAFRAQMLFQYHGPDSWHPNPEFLFKPGAGPLLDFGPYYLTDAVLALGTVKRVVGGVGLTPRRTRMVGTGPLAGREFSVDVPTTVVAILEHESGAVTDISFSFDAQLRREEVTFHTPGATVVATDPNRIGGTVRTLVRGEEVSNAAGDEAGWGRGVGVVDMVRALAADKPHRASGELAYHVLDVMLGIQEAIRTGRPAEVSSSAPSVPLLPADWHPERPLPGAVV